MSDLIDEIATAIMEADKKGASYQDLAQAALKVMQKKPEKPEPPPNSCGFLIPFRLQAKIVAICSVREAGFRLRPMLLRLLLPLRRPGWQASGLIQA